MDAGDIGFIRHRLKRVCENTVRNLQRMRSKPSLSMNPDACKSAIIVGAGPSLDNNKHLLLEAQESGWAIICVNASYTAIGGLLDPDICVIREQIDVGTGLRWIGGTLLVADIAAHESVWDPAGAFFIPAYPRFYDLARKLDVRPLFAGTAALTSAVAIALEHGAQKIALVGCDLAFAPDGHGYAQDSQWEDTRVEDDANGARMAGAGVDAMRGAAATVGMPLSIPERPQLTTATSWDGTATVRALETWEDQARWLEQLGKRIGDGVELIKTEGGRQLRGWSHRTLESILGEGLGRSDLSAWVHPPPSGERIDAAIRMYKNQCDLVERVAAEVLEPSQGGLAALWSGDHLTHAAFGGPLIEAFAGREIVDASGLEPARRCEQIYNAFVAGAQRMRERLEGS